MSLVANDAIKVSMPLKCHWQLWHSMPTTTLTQWPTTWTRTGLRCAVWMIQCWVQLIALMSTPSCTISHSGLTTHTHTYTHMHVDNTVHTDCGLCVAGLVVCRQWWASSNRDWDLKCDSNRFGVSIHAVQIPFEAVLWFYLKMSRFDLKDLNRGNIT